MDESRRTSSQHQRDARGKMISHVNRIWLVLRQEHSLTRRFIQFIDEPRTWAEVRGFCERRRRVKLDCWQSAPADLVSVERMILYYAPSNSSLPTPPTAPAITARPIPCWPKPIPTADASIAIRRRNSSSCADIAAKCDKYSPRPAPCGILLRTDAGHPRAMFYGTNRSTNHACASRRRPIPILAAA